MSIPDAAVQHLAVTLARHRLAVYTRSVLGAEVTVHDRRPGEQIIPTGGEISIARGVLADLQEMGWTPPQG